MILKGSKSKKSHRLGAGIVICILLLIIAFAYIVSVGQSHTIRLDFTASSLSPKQRTADFKYISSAIKKFLPEYDEYEKLYKFDYSEKETLYIKKLENCTGDFEFFCILNGYFNDIPSIHTNIVFPDKNKYSSYGCYNKDSFLRTTYNLNEAADYWYDCIEKDSEKFFDANIYCFNYSNNNYSINDVASSDCDMKRITFINGTDPVDYICNLISAYKLKYDHINKTPYREGIIFNDSFGEKIIVEGVDLNGKSVTKEFYYSLETETAHILKGYFEQNTQNKNEEEKLVELDYSLDEIDTEYFYIYKDYDNSVVYAEILGFDNCYGINLKSALEKCLGFENIIIDIRYNSGGYIQYFSNYIYPFISDKSIVYENRAMFKKNEFTKEMLDLSKYSLTYNVVKKENKTYCLSEIYEFTGGKDIFENVYILIGSNTASAADFAASFVKENSIGALIGTHTAGEGRTGSFLMNKLPQSGLLFTYNFCEYENSDGKDNSVYGTAPDIYSTISDENIELMENIKLCDGKAYTYENRLKWDDVLIETLELIKEDENDKGNNAVN